MDSPGVCVSFVRQPYVNFLIRLFSSSVFPTILFYHSTSQKGAKADAQNYRGISKLSAIPKAFERIITSHLQHLCSSLI